MVIGRSAKNTGFQSRRLKHSVITPDTKHSTKEERLIATGRNLKGRAIFVAFTVRHYVGGSYIRPVSARYMHKKEVKAYEKKSTPF